METDAEDMYFVREIDPGVCRLLLEDDDGYAEITGWKLTPPKSGVAHLSLDSLPTDAEVGDFLNYRIEITDPSRIEAFRNEVTLKVLPPRDEGGGGGGGSTSTKNTGSGGSGGSNVLALPNVIPVPEADWELRGMNELSALHIKHAGEGDDGSEHQVYDFYVNIDNKYLKTAQKEAPTSVDPKLLKAQFQYALVLLGLGLLQDEKHITQAAAADSEEHDGAEPVSIENMVDLATRAVAPILLPMIDALGHLSLGDDPED